jgi:hypothetical protein
MFFLPENLAFLKYPPLAGCPVFWKFISSIMFSLSLVL